MLQPHDRRQNPLPVYAGCFSKSIPLVEYGYYKYQSSGYCANICYEKDELVLGLSNGTQCWCGDLLPPAQEQVSDSRCDTPCQGYNLEDCGGGDDFFTVWLTGIRLNVANYQLNGASSSSSSSSTRTTSSSKRSTTSTSARSTSAQGSQTSTTGASTTTAGAAAQQPTSDQGTASQQQSNSSHDRRLGIILGVVLGVVALIVLLILLWWLLRRRKRQSPSAAEKVPSPPEVSGEKEASTVVPAKDPEERPVSTIGPLMLHPPIFLGSNTRTTTQTSTTTTTSVNEPFYTPLEEPPFAYHASTVTTSTALGSGVTTTNVTSTAPGPGVTTTTHATSSPLAREPENQSNPVPATDYQTMSPYANPLESNNTAPYPDPFTSEAGDDVEDTGVGFMSVNNGHTTPPGLMSLSNGSKPAGTPVAMSNNSATGDQIGNSHARIGSVLVAIRDFVARSPDEISMVRGDRIVLVERDDKYNDGWFLGQHTANGKIGIFPQSFTTLN